MPKPLEIIRTKVRYTTKFYKWLSEERIENQSSFAMQALYEIYINAIVWGETPEDLEIPKAELIVRM